jgi:radical SAM superfamily enzyme YgiQ (UPF0313 family)
MRIAIVYPPLSGKNRFGRLAQNRQFFWSAVPSFVFPVVLASAATLGAQAGHEIFWLDGIAEKLTLTGWRKKLFRFRPDLIMLETKTPVVKYHWKIIAHLKSALPGAKIVLVGDHVTALPQESMANSVVDYVLTGGNYDFLFMDLINHIDKKTHLPPGVWYRENGITRCTGRFNLNQNLDRLPMIDRKLTKWQLYSQNNGNFKYSPATYIMAGRDCWWRRNGGCTFCSWTTLYPKYHIRSVNNVLDEIGHLIRHYGVREIFDDTGTFPVGGWLKDFCQGMINRGYHKKIRFGCNLRFGVLTADYYELLAKAGFRFLLFGLESANQKTTDRLDKGITVSKIEKELAVIQSVNKTRKERLEPHLTYMLGYPWETEADANKTVSMVNRLFRLNLVNTIQATIVVPYPGTRLFAQAKKNRWLKTYNWDDYDMSGSVFNLKINRRKLGKLIRSMYLSCFTPTFILNRLKAVRTLEDIAYLGRGALKAIGHSLAFSRQN